MKMNSSAEIHGARNAWIGTRMTRDHSRRMMVHSPIQLMVIGRIGTMTGSSCVSLLISRTSSSTHRGNVFRRGASRGEIGVLEPCAARELALGAFAHDPPTGNDRDGAGEPLDLFQVMGSEQDRLALAIELLEITPQIEPE